jgi:hypothetical protein
MFVEITGRPGMSRSRFKPGTSRIKLNASVFEQHYCVTAQCNVTQRTSKECTNTVKLLRGFHFQFVHSAS